MALIALNRITAGGTPAILSFLQTKRVLARDKQCPSCGATMDVQVRSDVSDGYRWRCPVLDCRKSVTLRKGSFFEKSKIDLEKWLLLMHFWARQYPVTDAYGDIGVSEASSIQVYSWFRDVCSHRLCSDPPIKLGGPGKVVAIDESLFSHKPKVL